MKNIFNSMKRAVKVVNFGIHRVLKRVQGAEFAKKNKREAVCRIPVG